MFLITVANYEVCEANYEILNLMVDRFSLRRNEAVQRAFGEIIFREIKKNYFSYGCANNKSNPKIYNVGKNY